MSDDKPDPIEDVRKGLGLLFRAARGAIEKLPTKDFEEAVTTGAREVGRAIENVAETIEREVFHPKDGHAAPGPRVAPPGDGASTGKPEGKVEPEEPPKEG
jgi:hypothetical protein